MKIEHLFFDLDRTLWDFETNSYEELTNLYHVHSLHQLGVSLPDEFIKVYKKINESCWEKYRLNQLSKEKLRSERFLLTLEYFGISNYELATKIGNDYVNNSPFRTKLIPFTIELLNALKDHFQLHIITNGFEEVQHIKLRESGLNYYFNKVITSEMAGVKKPNPIIFDYALKTAGALVDNSVMIGDDLNTDISGAIKVNMKAIYYNPHQKVHDFNIWKEVQNLNEIKKILL
tara:strand:+ start:2598 stop:3293 length:696 start_codon:yes stop_codon:yes gene_type:complete